MKLTYKFTLLLFFLIVLSQVLVYSSVRSFTEKVVADVLLKYGHVVSAYDTEKTLAPVIKEVQLTRNLLSEPTFLNWVKNPEDLSLQFEAEHVLENYRWHFQSNNFFVALNHNLGYYYNNELNEHQGDLLRHHLSKDNPLDAWYFELIESGRDVHININPDGHLNITRLWVDMLIRDGDEVLGIAGTGIDFNPVETTLFDYGIEGVDSLFIDSNFEVQLHREQGKIRRERQDLHHYQQLSLANFVYIDDEYKALESVLAKSKNEMNIQSTFITHHGNRHLIVANYIEELDWFELTLVDMNIILPKSKFQFLYAIFGGILFIFLVAIWWGLHRWVTKPIKELKEKTGLIGRPDSENKSISFLNKPSDEIGSLMGNFENMSATIVAHTAELESKVRQRTLDLERIAKHDVLTELLNRRGMEAELKQELNYALRSGSSFGLLLLDIDNFKNINDSLGHDKGDQALILIAKTITEIIRDYDSACRWGGDEFLIMLRNEYPTNLIDLAERLRIMVSNLEVSSTDGVIDKQLSVSIGCTEVNCDMSVNDALLQADAALYHAKNSGRNRVCMWNEEL
jgi:diguanylate cyclase (GGDEF)-like protein